MQAAAARPDGALADLRRAIELGKSHEEEFLIQHTSNTPIQVMNPKGSAGIGHRTC